MTDIKQTINLNNSVIIFNTLDYSILLNNINIKTSVIVFTDTIEKTQLQGNNKIDKLIFITNKKYNCNNKKIYTASKITESLLKKAEKNIFLIIKTSNNYKFMKQIIKNLIILKKICKKLNINLGIYYDECTHIGFIQNGNTIYYNDIINALKAIYLEDTNEQYEFIYENVCNYLDTQFKKNNFCDFKNDECIANREKQSAQTTMGCCYSFQYDKFWSSKFIKNTQLCEHLNGKTCDTKCITCKMFTCDYLKKKQIKFNTSNILLLDCFFNKKQHLILESSFFKTKEEILKKLRNK